MTCARFRLPVVTILATIIGAALAPAARAGSCPVPGSYVVTLTGRLPTGPHFTRLAMYAFAGDCQDTAGSGTIAERFWYWRGDATGRVYGSTGRRIGDVVPPDPGYAGNADRRKTVQGLRSFHRGRSGLTTLTGTWTRAGNVVSIAWSGGDTESWRFTWQDDVAAPHLRKLELTAASYVQGAIYLAPDGTRDPSAPNAGFAFGGPGPDFAYAAPIANVAATSYLGLIRRHNAWCGAPSADDLVSETGLTLPLFRLTTTGVYRYVAADAPYWVFAYFAAPPRNPHELARRVILQTSHDWNGNGTIADDLGHTYSGLQVIDDAGNLRGFVLADSSSSVDGCDEDHTISSLYYLDATDCDARYGVDPETPGECP